MFICRISGIEAFAPYNLMVESHPYTWDQQKKQGKLWHKFAICDKAIIKS